eukprot:3867331-Rhodomonas_salina.1
MFSCCSLIEFNLKRIKFAVINNLIGTDSSVLRVIPCHGVGYAPGRDRDTREPEKFSMHRNFY